MNTNKLMLATLLAALSLPALAEEDPAAQSQTTVQRVVMRDGPVQVVSGPNMLMVSHGPGARLVKNAPYSAQMVTERQQNLSDGNQIAVQHSTMFYRDSAGRTRQEIRDPSGEVKTVIIHDPVARTSWVLNPRDRSATKLGMGADGARAAAEAARKAGEDARKAGEAARKAGEAARAQIEQMRKDGTLPTVERRKLADGSEEIIVKRVAGAAGVDAAQIQKDVRIQVLKGLEANGTQLRELQANLAPLTFTAFGDSKWAAKAVTKDLGSRDFGGVKADGKLRSYEIPAGEIGNRHPIVVADETWYAPDLKIAVYTKHSDPRSGDVVFHLEGLKREEPAASLFAVPSDYTVHDTLVVNKDKPQ